MNVSVFGLGYVGAVSAACFAHRGHSVVGVDVNPDKVNTINSGKSPIIEPGLEDLLQEGVAQGRLSATTDTAAAVAHADVCLVCVGTPSDFNGSLDLQYLKRVCAEIGAELAKSADYKVVALRSTMLPGTVMDHLLPILEESSGKKAGPDFGVVANPEFLRESSAIKDFDNPPFTLIGQLDARAGDTVAALYEGIPAPVYRTDPDTACMVKYASNAYHALKIAFANEIGRVCEQAGIDAAEVMDIFSQDTKLNISARYLRPGFAFGGSCLPKDLRAILYYARHTDTSVPVLEAILPSNEQQVQMALDKIQRSGKKNVAIVGLSFKPGTDDLRESPMVHLAETLLGKGYNLRIYDRDVHLTRLIGKNKAYIEQVIPHIAALMDASLDDALASAEVVVTGHGMIEGLAERLRPGQIVLDVTRIGPAEEVTSADVPVAEPAR